MSKLPQILSLGTANPPQRWSQREVYDLAARIVPMYRNPRIEQIFMGSDIEFRHLALEKNGFTAEETADQLHERFSKESVKLGKEAIDRCLANAGVAARDVDCFIAVSCTGYLCPGLSALLIREMGMRDDVQRGDLVGMGCAGAMPGLQRANDYALAHPGKKALVLTVEICSACYYVDDDLETVVGNAICADGAAAILVGQGENNGGAELLRFETLLEPSYIDTVGFQFKTGKLRIVLSKDIRDVAGGLAENLIRRLLKNEGYEKSDIAHWVIHSGGRKVIDSIKKSVGLTEEQLQSSRSVLRNFGNMSSPTVLFVLDEIQRSAGPRAGELGVLLAMGPGLAVEAALLRW
jgi:alkylresorcinol/alkylpyrone synthase/polyketide synthase Type III